MIIDCNLSFILSYQSESLLNHSTVNNIKYLEILESNLLPFIHKWKDRGLHFFQDNIIDIKMFTIGHIKII